MSSTILVVDDEALPRKNIARVLEEEEYHVYEAENGDEAIKAINDLDFDLVLCDLKIPGTDGRGVLRHVRSVSPQTMFILMTGYASLETAIEGFRGGVHDYILKPLVFEDVLQKVKRLMVSKSLAWEVELLRRQANSNSESTGVIGESCSIREILATISKRSATGMAAICVSDGRMSIAAMMCVASATSCASVVSVAFGAPVDPDVSLRTAARGYGRGVHSAAVTVSGVTTAAAANRSASPRISGAVVPASSGITAASSARQASTSATLAAVFPTAETTSCPRATPSCVIRSA